MKLFQTVISTFVIIVLCAVMGMGCMLAVYLIPVDRMQQHLTTSAELLSLESTHEPFWDIRGYTLDIHTDSLMLMETADNDSNHSAFQRSLLCSHLTDEKETDEFHMRDFLIAYALHQNPPCYRVTYARYWHGYQLWLKPLLYFTDYHGIRIFVGTVQIILTALLLLTAWKKDRKILLLLLPICGALLLPAMVCMEYMSLYSIIIISAVVMLKRQQCGWYFFLVVGVAVAYFDYLTYPIVSLGILLLLHGIIQKYHFPEMILFSSAWGIGYAGMWACKWILATAFTDENVFLDAWLNFAHRSADNAYLQNFNLWDIILKNVRYFISSPAIWLFLICFVICIVMLFQQKKYPQKEKIFACLFVGVLPFLWYAVLKNHSWVHAFMTNKDLSLTITAFLAFIMPYNIKKPLS